MSDRTKVYPSTGTAPGSASATVSITELSGNAFNARAGQISLEMYVLNTGAVAASSGAGAVPTSGQVFPLGRN